jgi:hypothetical protein
MIKFYYFEVIKMKIVCLGDSLTYGYGVEKNNRWTQLIKSELNAEIINKGINGDTTAGMLMRSYNDIIKDYPTHSIIMGGTNDFLAGKNASDAFQAIKIITKEKPDSLLPTLGGQTGLNLAMELAESGFLDEQGVKLLGTATEAIKMAEDRQAFKDTMESIGEPCIASRVVTTVDDALAFADEIDYPVLSGLHIPLAAQEAVLHMTVGS